MPIENSKTLQNRALGAERCRQASDKSQSSGFVIDSILNEKLILVIRDVAFDDLITVAEAVYDGGVRLLEVAFDATGRTTDEETGKMIAHLSKAMKDKMIVGAGTVLSPHQVQIAAEAGALFIISPDANESVITETRTIGLVSIPGAMTPTEIQRAHLLGADFVKLFPAGNLGPSYMKAVKNPLSHINLLAVAGIHPENIGEYLAAGACGFGISSGIVDKNLVAARDFSAISERAKSYTTAIASYVA